MKVRRHKEKQDGRGVLFSGLGAGSPTRRLAADWPLNVWVFSGRLKHLMIVSCELQRGAAIGFLLRFSNHESSVAAMNPCGCEVFVCNCLFMFVMLP